MANFYHCQDRWEQLHKGPEFAIKEFHNRADFEDELNALKFFYQEDTRHKHLIKVLAAYSHCGKDFLVFPLAKGNLLTFWEQADGTWDCEWMLQQCQGIAEGLKQIHRCKVSKSSNSSYTQTSLIGRHGDIKPQNILWFPAPQGSLSTDKGRLVLSDFTLVRFHAQGSNTETTVNRIGWSHTYRAPEKDSMPDKPVTQKYDVWSLGCVYLNFVSCYLVGYAATHGRYFKGDNDLYYQSFATTRQIEELIDDDRSVPTDKYFRYIAKMYQPEVKTSVQDVSLYLKRRL